MDTIRRFVFPVIWMLILGLIALALAKMAFFPSGEPDSADPGSDVTPVAEFDEYATVPVETGDISSVLSLTATVQADEGKKVLASHTGEITKIWVEDGERIQEGARILQVRVPKEPEILEAPEELVEQAPPAAGAEGADGAAGPADTAELVAPAAPQAPTETEYRYYDLEAEDSGTVQDLTALKGQSLTLGDEVATLSPGTYSIVADLTPEQQLDLLDTDVRATADLPTSSDPVDCAAPSIEEQEGEPEAPTSEVDPMTGETTTTASTSAQLRCAVPEDAKVVPGLSVDVSVDLGSAEGVLTLPTTAVEGELSDGAVYQVDEATGEPVRREITLGLRGDGVVEVTDGLAEGDEVLQFVPGVENPEDPFAEEGGGW